MKKRGFIEGAKIATISNILNKILGLLYVIPFYALIGQKGGALYGYAYMLYAIFLGISSVGLPSAMAKITSEYNAKGQSHLKNKAFSIGKNLNIVIGIFSFLILFIFAPTFAKLIIGDITGGNSVEDVIFVVRVISTAIIIVPILSITRGYVQGHKYIKEYSIANILEQLSRVLIIIVGSYISVKVLHLSLRMTVAIAAFAATIGALISYIYLVIKIKRHKEEPSRITEEEKAITNKEIIKKLIIYTVPFVMIYITGSIYNLVNSFTVVKELVNSFGYAVNEAEAVMGIFSTWGYKLNSLVSTLCSGLVISLIPNITASFVKKDMKDVKAKVFQTLKIILILILPITLFLSFFAEPVWTVFYGHNELGIKVFAGFILISFFESFYTVLVMVLQSMNKYKMVFISLIIGIILKITLNVPMMHLANYFGIAEYYGPVITNILCFSVPTVINLLFLRKELNFRIKELFILLTKNLLALIAIFIILYLLKVIIPLNQSRFVSIIILGGYGSLYLFLYIIASKLIGTFEELKKIFLRKIKRSGNAA